MLGEFSLRFAGEAGRDPAWLGIRVIVELEDSPTEPRDLGARLLARGFTLAGDVKARLMTVELPLPARVNAAVRVEECRDAASLERWLRFVDPEADDAKMAGAVRDRLRFMRQHGERVGFLVGWIGDAAVRTQRGATRPTTAPCIWQTH